MLPASGTTTVTVAITMLDHNSFVADSNVEHKTDPDGDNTTRPSSPGIEQDFDESQCLFCNYTSPDLDQNLFHMSKNHGLYVKTKGLLVDVGCLLAYFVLVTTGYNECLYCGTQRNTREAIQQHMLAKSHCKYDISREDAELRDFYEVPSADANEEVQLRLSTMRFTDDSQLPSQPRMKKSRPPKHPDTHAQDITAPALDQTVPTPTPQSLNQTMSNSDATEIYPLPSSQLTTRAQKQDRTLDDQLAQLRANDRRSLVHLPASQQRALLATHHKQMETARRTEQSRRGHLESAGNKFSRLGTTRLVRIPPHLGHVQSLNR